MHTPKKQITTRTWVGLWDEDVNRQTKKARFSPFLYLRGQLLIPFEDVCLTLALCKRRLTGFAKIHIRQSFFRGTYQQNFISHKIRDLQYKTS